MLKSTGSFLHGMLAGAAVLAIVSLLIGCNSAENQGDRRASATAKVAGETQLPTSTETADSTRLASTATPTVVATLPPSAAIVNGEYILLADYERQVAQYKQALVDQGLDLESEDGRTAMAQMSRDVLDSMIDNVLIRQGGTALGVSLSDEELDAQIAADIESGGGQESFEEWLKTTGQTYDDYREMVRELLFSQRVLDVLSADLPTEAEQVHARQIVVDSPAAAQEILAQIRKGTDFAELAQERSLDPLTSEDGGDLGWLPRGLLAPELEDAAFSLNPGQTSEVIPLEGEYYILEVIEREDLRPLSAEGQADLGLAAFDQWLEGLRLEAKIQRLVSQ